MSLPYLKGFKKMVSDEIEIRRQRRRLGIGRQRLIFTYEQIVHSSRDDFLGILNAYVDERGHPLTEDDKQYFRELRRKFKNREAARKSREAMVARRIDLDLERNLLEEHLARIQAIEQ